MKYFLPIWVLILTILQAPAQIPDRGLILHAETGKPVEGATIEFLPSGLKTSSDRTGRFRIVAPMSDTLIITYAGFRPVRVPPGNGEPVIRLQPVVNSLAEVVVSASRAEQRREQVPLAISKLDAVTLREARPTALYQVINQVPGVYMVNLGNEQHTMAIRQPVTYNALYLYLEDGLPIRPTGIFNHNALYEINMHAVKSVEVIKGPASSLYGSNSIGGAVNFSSLDPPLVPSADLSLQGDLHHFYRADARGGFTSGRWGIDLSGYAAGQKDSWQDYTDFGRYAASFKARYTPNAATRFTIAASWNSLDTQTPGTLDGLRFSTRSYGSNQRFAYRRVNAFRANARMDQTWNNRNQTFFTLFFRNNSTGQLPAYYITDLRDQNGRYTGSAGQQNEQRFTSGGFLLQHRAALKFLNSSLIAGISVDHSPGSFYAEYLRVSKDVSRNYYTGYTRTDSITDQYDLKLFNSAAYLQYELHPAGPLTVVLGVRYDQLRYTFSNGLPPDRTRFKQYERNRYHIFAPKAGITYNFPSGAGVYGNFSVGFQPPETSSLYSSRQLASLKEAKFYNSEIGGWFPLIAGKLRAEATLYRLTGKNEIISVLMPDNTSQNQNAGETLHSGIEYSLVWDPSRAWAFRLGGTFARHYYRTYSEVTAAGTSIYDGKRMPNAPKWIANGELTWKPSLVPGTRAALEWQHIGRYFVDPAHTGIYPGYDLLNLRLAWEPGVRFAKGAAIWLHILNMTDQLYATTVAGNRYGVTYTAAPPRTFALGISYAFNQR